MLPAHLRPEATGPHLREKVLASRPAGDSNDSWAGLWSVSDGRTQHCSALGLSHCRVDASSPRSAQAHPQLRAFCALCCYLAPTFLFKKILSSLCLSQSFFQKGIICCSQETLQRGCVNQIFIPRHKMQPKASQKFKHKCTHRSVIPGSRKCEPSCRERGEGLRGVGMRTVQ